MGQITDYPALNGVLVFLALWLATRAGAGFCRRRWPFEAGTRDDFMLILTSTLTLLALLIGFTFSMAASRYDQRKNYEEAEANAIGTEYLRADLLPAAQRSQVRALLRQYLDLRIQRYATRDEREVVQLNARTDRLQAELWAAVLEPARAQPTPITQLAVSGMNDVINSQGYAQAAERNRIPLGAWILLALVSVCCSVLVGYGAQSLAAHSKLLLTLPLVLGISLFLIADIDAPRGGVIRVSPENLASLAAGLRGP